MGAIVNPDRPSRLPAVFSPVRCLMHLPVGLICGWALLYAATLGFGILLTFGLYEIDEDSHIRDCAYVDVIGCLLGLCMVASIDMGSRLL